MKSVKAANVVMDVGVPFRMWPFSRGKSAVLSIGNGRPHEKKQCVLLLTEDGVSWERAGEFFTSDARQSTTGQPFITSQGTVLVPVWDVDYYTQGKTYFCIQRSAAGASHFEMVYEDEQATYANHFLEDEGDGAVYLGVGVKGGGSGGKIGFTPDSGYILRSSNDGQSFQKVFTYDRPCCFYQGAVTRNSEILFTTRNQRSLINVSYGVESHIGDVTRSLTYLAPLNQFIMTSNSAIYISSDAIGWHKIKFPIPGYVLRYPTLVGERLLFTAVGRRSLLVVYKSGKWLVGRDLSGSTRSTFARLARLGGTVFCGSEFDGKLLALPVDALAEGGKKVSALSGVIDQIRGRLSRILDGRSRLVLEQSK